MSRRSPVRALLEDVDCDMFVSRRSPVRAHVEDVGDSEDDPDHLILYCDMFS